MTLRKPLISADVVALAALIALWLFFFWRLFTPVKADQSSLVNGDFSGQFVAFGAYQYERFAAGEAPLWDPYNNGGLPFIGDPQAAVFYPPRLATIALSRLAGGWTYHALELEMTAHILLYSLTMYALVRRLTKDQPGSVVGGFIGAVIMGYGGFVSSYPPLQLAILEAASWLPLALVGIVEAARSEHLRLSWLVLTGFALGLSWMAGHPQTSFFLTYLLAAYFGWRVFKQKYRWTAFVKGIPLFGGVAIGMAAIQLLPGLEYLARTTRSGLSFDAKGNGLLFQDITQFIFPGILGPWSPLYVGIVGLALALIALWRRLPGSLFWGVAALVGLVISVGANSAVYHALYNLLPGMRFFREQERAAFLVASSLAILAGLGAAHLVTWDRLQDFKATRRVQQGLMVLTVGCALFTAGVIIPLIGSPEVYTQRVSAVTFSTIMAGTALLVIPWVTANPARRERRVVLAALVAFELFSVNIDNSNYESVPPDQQLAVSPLVADIMADKDGLPYRVDGYRGLQDNYGSMYGIMDMRGISPLFLDDAFQIIEPDHINPAAWEVFAVRYVFTDWNELPVPSKVVASGEDRLGSVNLHRLTDPRPFALLVYGWRVVDQNSLPKALHSVNLRQQVVLTENVDVEVTANPPQSTAARVIDFQPEQFTIEENTPVTAFLSVANPYYPGWEATIDGQPTTILRAYGAVSAVVVPAGEHIIRFVYDPLTYRIGALISLFTWSALAVFALVVAARRWRQA